MHDPWRKPRRVPSPGPGKPPALPWEVGDPAAPQVGDLPLQAPPQTPPEDLFGGQIRT